MSLCLSVLVIMLLNYSKITTNATFYKMVTLTRYYNYILHTCILPILTKWYIPRFRRSAAQVQCIIVNCGTFTNMPSLAALEQPFQAAISSPRNRRNGGGKKENVLLKINESCLLIRYGNMTGVLNAREGARSRHQSCCHTLATGMINLLRSTFYFIFRLFKCS